MFLKKNNSDWNEACGVCGIYNHPDSARLSYLGLTSLQHRGHESAGLVTFTEQTDDHTIVHQRVKMGLVFDAFKEHHFDSYLKGNWAIGHVRYSTSGCSDVRNAQPFVLKTQYGKIAISHNGNLTNAQKLRHDFEKKGISLQTDSDSELVLYLISTSRKKNLLLAIKDALQYLEGAYCFLIASGSTPKSSGYSDAYSNTLFAIRDPHGFRPLCIGKLGSGWVIASETCAFNLIDAIEEREIDPGEIIIFQKGKQPVLDYIEPQQETSCKKQSLCIFEHIYFARPDSSIFGESVYEVRREIGRQLAREHPVEDADCVIAVPDSALVSTIGYSETSKLPFEIGFIRGHYSGRTFIEPSLPMRNFKVKVKYNPIKENIRGKKIVLVDDSIVRGTTSKNLVHMLLSSGVKEIHMRIASPPVIASCFYGINTPTTKELIAYQKSKEEIRKFLQVDSLEYISVEGMLSSTRRGKNFCTACFSGNYPVPISESNNE